MERDAKRGGLPATCPCSKGPPLPDAHGATGSGRLDRGPATQEGSSSHLQRPEAWEGGIGSSVSGDPCAPVTARYAKATRGVCGTGGSIGEDKELTCLQTTSVRTNPKEMSTRLRIPVLLSSEPDVPWASENAGHPVPEQNFFSELGKTFPRQLLTHKEHCMPHLRSDALSQPEPTAGHVTISSMGMLPTAPSLLKTFSCCREKVSCSFDAKGFPLKVRRGPRNAGSFVN